MKQWIFSLLGISAILLSSSAQARRTPRSVAPLSLDNFLVQVRENNGTVRAAELRSEGAESKTAEANLIYAPIAFTNVGYLFDQRPVLQPSFQPSLTRAAQINFGFSHTSSFGLNAKLYQNIIATQLSGASPAFLPTPNFIDASPVLELTQPFWRNGFGKETQAQVKALESSYQATKYAESFQTKIALASAEAVYWRLSFARENLEFQQDSLDRAKKIRDWASRRTQMDLADKADLLQADALFKLREYELKAVQDEVREASRAFNLARGSDSDAVMESVEELDSRKLAELKVPTRSDLRDDVKAAKEQREAIASTAEMGRHKLSPNLDLTLTASLNGRDPTFQNSIAEAFTSSHPYLQVGLKFATPLDFSLMKEARAGYERDRLAAETQFTRKLLEQESNWKDLVQRFEDRKSRLELVQRIETAQKAKLDHERDRLTRAKTTTYQVLLFEEDYANSRRNRLKLEAELLALFAEMKTFGGPNESR